MIAYDVFYKKLCEISRPCKRIEFSVLDENKWPTWLRVVGENDFNFDFVAPNKVAISKLSSQINYSNPDVTVCNALLESFSVCSQYSGWDQAKTMLIQWLSNPNRQLNSEAAYQLTCILLASGDKEFINQVTDAVGRQEFYNFAQHEPVGNVPAMYAMCAMIFMEKLQEMAGPDVAKQFWAGKGSAQEVLSVVQLLDRFNQMDVIWLLSRDERNISAIDFIKSNLDDYRLLGLPSGARYIGEFSWADADYKLKLTLRLVAEDI